MEVDETNKNSQITKIGLIDEVKHILKDGINIVDNYKLKVKAKKDK